MKDHDFPQSSDVTASLQHALDEWHGRDPVPDVADDVMRILDQERRSCPVCYALVQAVLLGALLGMGCFYLWSLLG